MPGLELDLQGGLRQELHLGIRTGPVCDAERPFYCNDLHGVGALSSGYPAPNGIQQLSALVCMRVIWPYMGILHARMTIYGYNAYIQCLMASNSSVPWSAAQGLVCAAACSAQIRSRSDTSSSLPSRHAVDARPGRLATMATRSWSCRRCVLACSTFRKPDRTTSTAAKGHTFSKQSAPSLPDSVSKRSTLLRGSRSRVDYHVWVLQ